MSEAAVLNYLAGTSDFGDAAAIRRIAAYIDAATGDGSPEGAVTGAVGDLYTDSTNGHLYIKGSGTGNTGWVQLESATSGSGDVNGPGSATDNALVRFDGTGGKTVQNSGITVDDSGNITSDVTVSKAAASINMDAAAGSATNFRWRAGGANRWAFIRNGVAESGSNAGSNFQMYKFTDGGTGSVNVEVTRSTGRWTFQDVGATAGLELGSSGPRIMSGTGSPEGVVTAPVGSTWTDTATTTGAIQWIKATGTGNTGWVVEYGDTGQRNMSAEALSNGWAVASSIFRLRRCGSRVELTLAVSKTSATADTVYTLPSGFRPPGSVYAVSTSATDDYADVTVSSGGLIIISRTYMNVATHYLSMSFFTTDEWPATLPGS